MNDMQLSYPDSYPQAMPITHRQHKATHQLPTVTLKSDTSVVKIYTIPIGENAAKRDYLFSERTNTCFFAKAAIMQHPYGGKHAQTKSETHRKHN